MYSGAAKCLRAIGRNDGRGELYGAFFPLQNGDCVICGTLLSSFGEMHFLASLCLWRQYFATGTGRLDPATLLTCGTAVLLLLIYAWAMVLFVRCRRQGWRVLIAGILLSAAFFITDVREGNFQTERMASRIVQGSGVGIGTRHHYLNWWWYSDVDLRSVNHAQTGQRGDRTAQDCKAAAGWAD